MNDSEKKRAERKVQEGKVTALGTGGETEGPASDGDAAETSEGEMAVAARIRKCSETE